VKFCIESVGLAAPGLESWAAAQPILRGESPYARQDLSVYQPNLLPPNERRRAAPAVRLAFRVAEDALTHSAFKPAELASVFTTSEADTSILHRLCTALAQPARALSPTDFHNSVHNAAAGYWSIAAGARRPSTSLSAFDGSFVAGLIEAATQVATEGEPVLLVCYDVVPPVPLHATRPIADAFGCALVLTSNQGVGVRLARSEAAETVIDHAALEPMRRENPAARALPLLQLVATGGKGSTTMAGVGGCRWRLDVG
jgi:hypothetical protein